ncbi:MAG TPA: hypothetical protein VNW92_30470 [Polyangiaceae bacterium]|jgi:hypothetical protein|nr:hypothetical protein [Polyangiaceae bacterium]
MKAALVCFGALLLGVVACGSSDGGGGSGGSSGSDAGGFNFGGASGSGGATNGGAGTAGASTGGGTNGGGTNGGAGTAGAPAGGAPGGGQCSPGTTHTAENMYDQKLTQCLGYKSTAAGFPTTTYVIVDQLELTGSLTAGKPYAISTDLAHVSENVGWEIWGADGFCGPAEEQLYKSPVTTGPACAAFTPKANHNAMLLVITGPSDISYGYASLTDCPNGTCGK